MEEEIEKETGKGSERWSAAIVNLSEMATNLESLQKLLVKKAVYVDEETFAKAFLSSEQARTIKVCCASHHQMVSHHFHHLVPYLITSNLLILPSGFVFCLRVIGVD